MEVLGRTLISPFNNFWKTFSQDISINKEFIEQGHSLIFQDQGLDQTTSFPPRWIELPDPDLAYHVAHELSHLVLNSKKYPRLLIEKQFKNDKDQNRIKDDLQELVDHIAINFLLKPFEFRNDFITQNTANGAIIENKGLELTLTLNSVKKKKLNCGIYSSTAPPNSYDKIHRN